MTDYSTHLVAARIALQALEDAANDGRWRDMQTAAQQLVANAEAMRFWAFCQPEPPAPTV